MKIIIKSFFYLIFAFISFTILSFIWGISFGKSIVMEKHINLESKLIPKNFNNTKISVVNDIYLDSNQNNIDLFNSTINKLNELDSDFLVLNGGLISPSIDKNFKLDSKNLINKFITIKAKFGKYVTFSSDEKKNTNIYKQLLDIYLKSGFIILDNTTRQIHYKNEKTNINFINFELENTAKLKLNDKQFNIAYSNLPNFVLNLKDKPINYYIHGNTLGGLVNFWFADKIFPQIKDLKTPLSKNNYNNISVIENTGIGTKLLPMRVWNNPKVYILHLINKE